MVSTNKYQMCRNADRVRVPLHNNMMSSLRSRNGRASSRDDKSHEKEAQYVHDADAVDSLDYESMPSPSETGRMHAADALSLGFMKAWSGLCCPDCANDPVDEAKLRQEIQASSAPSDLSNIAHLSATSMHVTTSISPLVVGPMSGVKVVGASAVIEGLIGEYMCICKFYQVPYNAGVVAGLRFSLPSLRTSGLFHDMDMLALVELLLRHGNLLLSYITRLDFTMAIHGKTTQRSGFTSHGALALAKALQTTQHITQVWMPRHRIGPYGASAIFLACRDNPSIRQLNMRRCRIGERGALAFCEILLNRERHPEGLGLADVDLSTNGIGHSGTVAIQHAVTQWNVKTPHSPLSVNLEGNLVFPEIMNAVTHGLGVILCMIGGYVISERVKEQSLTHRISCSIYTTSLFTLYLSSTLYHSFFPLQHIKYIFQVMDKCAIYVLIAGSYTPFLMIIFHENALLSYGLLGFIWTCCFLGVSVEAFAPTWKWRPTFSLAMYLGMGWASMVVLPDAGERLPMRCIHLLILGGVGYTVGVPFFVRDNNLDHALWHLFVLSGSIFHWLAVYLYVAIAPLTSQRSV